MLQKKKRRAIPIMTHPGIELIGSSVLQAGPGDLPVLDNIQAFYQALHDYNDKR